MGLKLSDQMRKVRLREHGEFTATHKSVLLILAHHCNDKTRQWTISEELIAQEADCAESTARKAIVDLESIGLVTVKRAGGRNTNEYRINTTEEATVLRSTRRRSAGQVAENPPECNEQPTDLRRVNPPVSGALLESSLENVQEQREGDAATAPPSPPVASAKTRRRATPLPDDFSLTLHRRSMASDEGVDPERTFRKFVDHYRSPNCRAPRAVNWDDMWQSWCRREADFGGGRRLQQQRAYPRPRAVVV